jgi:hypothetical protein
MKKSHDLHRGPSGLSCTSAQVERLFHLFEVAFHAFDPLITCIKLAINTLEASIHRPQDRVSYLLNVIFLVLSRLSDHHHSRRCR